MWKAALDHSLPTLAPSSLIPRAVPKCRTSGPRYRWAVSGDLMIPKCPRMSLFHDESCCSVLMQTLARVSNSRGENELQVLMPSDESLQGAIAAINSTIDWTNAFGGDACSWLQARQGVRQVAAASSVNLNDK